MLVKTFHMTFVLEGDSYDIHSNKQTFLSRVAHIVLYINKLRPSVKEDARNPSWINSPHKLLKLLEDGIEIGLELYAATVNQEDFV